MRLRITLAALLLALAATAQQRKPNVVMVVIDGLSWQDMSAGGATPNIDRLYSQALHLADHHTDPIDAAGIASVLTGKYASRVGVWHDFAGRSMLNPDEATIAQLFSEEGYATALSGKWDLGCGAGYAPGQRGFGQTLTFNGRLPGQTPDDWANDGMDDNYLLNGIPAQFTGYCNDVWMEWAGSFIKEYRDQPFFCMIAPCGWDGMAQRSVDGGLGSLRSMINGMGLEDNTIIVLTGSNGRGTFGQRHRVPCLIYYRDGQLDGGMAFQEPSAHIDLLPTLAELCGITVDPADSHDGISLVKEFRAIYNPAILRFPSHRTIVVHDQRVDIPERYKDYCVIDGQWRMTGGALYDMDADPGMEHDLSRSQPQRLRSMQAAYGQWWDHISPGIARGSEIAVGDPAEPLTRLTCNDWREASADTWDVGTVRSRRQGNGWWAVNVLRTGSYKVTLRACPYGQPDTLDACKVSVVAADGKWEAECDPGDREAMMTIEIKAGSHRLQATLADATGKTRGVPVVYLEFIE